MEFASDYLLEESEEEDEVYEAPARQRPRPVYKPPPYNPNEMSYECEAMDFSDSDDDDEATGSEKPKPRKTNLNTVKLSMSCLQEPPVKVLPLSKLVRCGNSLAGCQAVISHIDKKEYTKDEQLQWTCRFCGFPRLVKIEEWPELEENDALYVKDVNNRPNMKVSKEDSKIIFVVDISASMSGTICVPRQDASSYLQSIVDEELQKEQERMIQMIRDAGGANMQVMPPQRTQNMEVSRLQAVKAAVKDPLEKLGQELPKKRIGLITFCDVVSIYGDGSQTPELLQGSALLNEKELYERGQAYVSLQSASESYDRIISSIRRVKEQGQTALGPALLVAMGMASDCKGSKVILCTDGLANIGPGRVENTTTASITDFYERQIERAKSLGISVSIISFDDCGLSGMLGQLVTETAGYVEKIKPTSFANIFAKELTRETLTTDTVIDFIVHQNMFVGEGQLKQMETKSNVRKIVGNVDVNVNKTFNFGFKSTGGAGSETEQMRTPKIQEITETDKAVVKQGSSVDPKSDSSTPTADTSVGHSLAKTDTVSVEYPLQVQISCRNMEGGEMIRVWTNMKKITKNRETAEQGMNINTVATTHAQNCVTQLLKSNPSDKQKEANVIKERTVSLINRPIFRTMASEAVRKTMEILLLEAEKVSENGTLNDETASKLLKIQKEGYVA